MTVLNQTPIAPDFPPKAQFRAWLRSLPADAVVARHWTYCDCPLAAWMVEAKIADGPEITHSYWRPDKQALTTEMPAWAKTFARRIDNYEVVTAADCLRVLAGTPRG